MRQAEQVLQSMTWTPTIDLPYTRTTNIVKQINASVFIYLFIHGVQFKLA